MFSLDFVSLSYYQMGLAYGYICKWCPSGY